MPNLAVVLKQEISRLARKEVRAQVGATRQAATQHRREIARLKRQLRTHEKKIAFLEARERDRLGHPQSAPSELLNGARFSATSVRSQRRRLKFSAEDYGRLVGVTGQTIYLWEQGKSRPRTAQLASLVALRKLGRRQALAQLEILGSSEGHPAGATKQKVRKPR